MPGLLAALEAGERPRKECSWQTRLAEGARLPSAGARRERFFRYKQILGGRLRALSLAGQKTEALVACNVLNRMAEMGRPASQAMP